MELDRYLEAIRNCPDELVNQYDTMLQRLTTDFGVYDNWPIFTNVSFDRLCDSLLTLEFDVVNDRLGHEGKSIGMDYRPGTVNVLVYDSESERRSDRTRFHVRPQNKIDKERLERIAKENHDRQKIDFGGAMLRIHSTAEKIMPDTHYVRAIALAVLDIGDLAKREKIGVCFPRSIGWSTPKDYSQIVYYYPES